MSKSTTSPLHRTVPPSTKQQPTSILPCPLSTNRCWSNFPHTTIRAIWPSLGPVADHSHREFSGYCRFRPLQGELGFIPSSPTHSRSTILSTPKQSQESRRVSTPYNPSTPPTYRRKKSTTPTKHKSSGLWPINWIWLWRQFWRHTRSWLQQWPNCWTTGS